LERTQLQKVKTGVFTGAYAKNPATAEAIPVWVADYVLGSYGTGAIMAVPAHDSRDHEFALAFGLPMRLVVSPREGQDWDQKKAYAGDGLLVNSSYEIDLNGLSTVEAGMKVTAWLEKMGLGKKQVRRRILLVSHDFEALKGTADDHMLVCSNGCFIWSWAGQLQTTRLVICQTKILGRAFSSCPLRRLW
jgi:hypothetical protein